MIGFIFNAVSEVLAASDLDNLERLSKLSVIAFFIIAGIGFHRGWWIFGTYHKTIVQDRDLVIADLHQRLEQQTSLKDAWMATALKSTGVLETLKEQTERGKLS